jgi:proteasome lid subunit RPN8/RPN11
MEQRHAGVRALVGAAFALLAAVVSSGCIHEAAEEEKTEESASALYDSPQLVGSGVLALQAAQNLTQANGNLWEYCGLVVRKANGQYRAGAPVTQNSQTFCSASISLSAGESVVGYYHTHPAGVDTEFSPEDIVDAEADSRMYFVACSDDCGYRYDPATNITSHLGCSF